MTICKTHPRYKGVRKSTTGCLKCKLIFGLRRIASACGFAVAQATPRGAKLEPSQEFPGVMEGPCFTAPQEAEDSWEAPNDAPRRQENFIFIGGKDHGCITSFSLEQRESAPNLYDGYLLTHFVDGSRAYVFPDIGYATAQQHLEQYAATGKMSPCAPAKHVRSYLLIGGRRNRCWHNVELEHGVGPDALTADKQQYFKVMFHGSSAGYEHIVYVEQGYDIKQAHQDVLRYERETPPDSGGKLC